jgi:hypothetical protein
LHGYDAAGNLVQKESLADGNTMIRKASYNTLNQLTNYNGDGLLPVHFGGTVSKAAIVTVTNQPTVVMPDPASTSGGQLFNGTINLAAGSSSNR